MHTRFSRPGKTAKKAAFTVLFAALFLLSPILALGQTPRLLVVIVAEQFRADYLDRYRAGFGSGGFERLLAEGAWFRRCRFQHQATLAAPGAAVLSTGAYAEMNGIVADAWYDVEQQRLVGAAESATSAGPSGDGEAVVSPGNLIGSTLADELRLATDGQSRVISISGRPEPAVFLGGRGPAGCYWRARDGRFRTSSYYADATPEWVEAFNKDYPASRHVGAPWKAVGAEGSASALRVLGAGGSDGAESFWPLYRASPFAMEDTLAFAERAIAEGRMGLGAYPDLLFINLSAPAYLALETGAESPLMRDLVLRLDKSLEAFLTKLDQQLGSGNAGVVFTATHGIPPLPTSARVGGVPSGRVSGPDVVDAMNAALGKQFGPKVFIEKYVYPFVYLSAEARGRPAAERTLIVRAAGEAASKLAGVAGYYSPLASSAPAALADVLRHTWNGKRSGSLMLLYEPFFVESYSGDRGTAPGSPYSYDTDVPLIVYGRRVRPGIHEHDIDAASVAPTLAALLRIAAPSGATGRVLSEALYAADAFSGTAVGPPAPR